MFNFPRVHRSNLECFIFDCSAEGGQILENKIVTFIAPNSERIYKISEGMKLTIWNIKEGRGICEIRNSKTNKSLVYRFEKYHKKDGQETYLTLISDKGTTKEICYDGLVTRRA